MGEPKAIDQWVIAGTWETRADWERWHESEPFVATRERLNKLEVTEQDSTWYETILDLQR